MSDAENGHGNGRVIVLNDHRKKQPTKAEIEQQMANNIANIAAAAAKEAVIPVVEWYLKQVPGLVASMLAEALQANGLTLKGPADGHTSGEVPEAARAQHADEPKRTVE